MLEKDFLEGALNRGGVAERKAAKHNLPSSSKRKFRVRSFVSAAAASTTCRAQCRPPAWSPAHGGGYLLRTMAITQPNQVWVMDITYVLMPCGFVYLAVVLNASVVACCRGAECPHCRRGAGGYYICCRIVS